MKRDFEALRQYGYKGGPSILKVPPPKELDKDKDWSWSTDIDNSWSTRIPGRKTLQKEKRKRDLGQASRGKNYVEEEKRLLRDWF
ncbi:hypothetical protein M0R45_006505 [Rubus argutus]|uniref:Uncharacterized protein n=1 Tax=Rubus argutus TaxID=59490 RepID=A0AAW1YR41_RUBAR